MEKHPQTSSEETTRSLFVLCRVRGATSGRRALCLESPGSVRALLALKGADGFLHLTFKLAKARQWQEFLVLLFEQNGCLGVGETSPEPAAGWAGLWLCTEGW